MKIREIDNKLFEKCWKGYEKKGMKTMFGKRVPNCVKKESVLDEDYIISLKGKEVSRHKTENEARSAWHKLRKQHGNDVTIKKESIQEDENKEVPNASYDNWDHKEAVSYAQFLESHLGKPDGFTNEQAVWYNKDGFKRIVCKDEYVLHGSPAPHHDFVYSFIDLEVPESLSDELAKCSGSILIDHLKNEVGARCGSLTANAVTLNFCLDVVAGRVEPTKDQYERRILDMIDMNEKGKKFELDWWPDETGDADPDNPYYKESMNVEECICEDLRAWFGKGKKGGAGGGGWDRYNTKGERIGKCGDAKKGEGKPKCLSKAKAASLRASGGKKAIGNAVSRKRKSDPNKDRRGKAKNVSNKPKK